MIHIKRIDEFAYYGVNEMAVKGSALANYDEVDIFDSKYFLVKKRIGGYQRDQYNLADRNGNLISEIWFDKIEKNDDGSIVVNKDNEREKDVTYSSVGELVKNVEIMDAAIDSVLSVQDISLTDTYPLTPYQITDKNTNTKKTIIARAMLDGKEVFVGDDGKLYNADGSVYTNPDRLKQWDNVLSDLCHDLNDNGYKYINKICAPYNSNNDFGFWIGFPDNDQIGTCVMVDGFELINTFMGGGSNTWEQLSDGKKNALKKIGLDYDEFSHQGIDKTKSAFSDWIMRRVREEIRIGKTKIPYINSVNFPETLFNDDEYYRAFRKDSLEMSAYVGVIPQTSMHLDIYYNPTKKITAPYVNRHDMNDEAVFCCGETSIDPLEYKKQAKKFYLVVIKCIWDVISAEFLRISNLQI